MPDNLLAFITSRKKKFTDNIIISKNKVPGIRIRKSISITTDKSKISKPIIVCQNSTRTKG